MVRVKVSEGLLEGELVQNEYGGSFYSFKGIPYAQPPVGNLRFKAPLPPKPWEGVRSAKEFGSSSFQFDSMTGIGMHGSEDSLYLNIYTPQIKPDKPLPVMFWIHGGGLICGNGEDDFYGPEYLVKEGVILVTINYRLEVLGFLCLETEDIPGNAGMKDQVEALRWVNKNISSFGGDPNNITIAGESAGAGSVSYHLVSPMTKGLFKRAIVQSGTTLCPWARAYKPRERALALARQLGCFSEDDKELYEFFRTQPPESLVNISVPIVLAEKSKHGMPFVVAVEKQYENAEAFFVGDYVSVHEGVEVMIGYTADEGLVNMGPADALKTKLQMARDFPEFFITKLLQFDLTINQQFELGKKIQKFYFNGKVDIPDDWEQLAKYYSMEMFVYGTHRFIRAFVKKNKIYLYKFSCVSERNIFPKLIGITELVKDKSMTSHGDDVLYLFNAKMLPKVDSNSNTYKLIQNVVKLCETRMVRVTVNEGLLEGELVQNEYGGTFYSFKGIPYAQPPVGNLRFKAPLPPKPWEGVRSAKDYGSKCCQLNLMTETIEGSEDCLYLNIYTPDIEPDKPMPVMFWIHGGAFIFGSGEDEFYGPEFLVNHEVVIVTINYRLEVLGFLSLETADIPGNAGLKDQVEALKWVNKNISNFGGDPNNITIFGESAGGGSVSYHLLSPMTKGLFKRAIVQSGSTFCPWARTSKPRDRALSLARQLGCYSENDKELEDFLKNQPLESLVGVSVPLLLSEKAKTEMVYFSVVEEKKIDNNERFFAADFNLVHEGVEVMIGYTADEGLVFLGPADTIKTKLEMARDFPEFFIPKFLVFDLTINQQLDLGKKIRKFYFNDKIDNSDNWEALTKFYSMDTFVYGILRFTEVCAKANKVYLYKFSCNSERNLCDIMGVKDIVKDKPVTCHGDDVLYLFNAKIMPNKVDVNSSTFKLMEKVIKLWTNFAKYGNPTPDESLGAKWDNYTIETQNYLNIGNQLVASTAPEAKELKFWNSFYEEYGQKLN